MWSRGSIKTLVAVLAVAATVASGCGSSSDEGETTPGPPASTSTTPGREAPAGATAKSCNGGEIRVTGVPCGLGRQLVSGWYKNDACSSPGGSSRTSCRLGRFTCLGAVTDRGIAVSCAAPGRSVSFIGRAR